MEIIFQCVFFKLIFRVDILITSCEIDLRYVPHYPIDDKVHTGLGNGLVPAVRHKAITWANKDPALWHRMAPLDRNKLNLPKGIYTTPKKF